MTWQLASFLLLAAALLAGFAWYERSHPSARVLALVATLAALAVLGRIAFAPIPNVKPSTDVVLIAGYVFGGAPGFAVGAITALVSNLFFTQGPWTPWQMAGWGLAGLLGALIARVAPEPTRGGRIALAAGCGAAGLAFGALVNFGSVVSFGSEDVLGRYLAYQALSLPWDLAHAGANVAFFAVFGPALVRTLRRFRTRLEFTWRAPAAGTPAVALAALALTGAATAALAAGPAAPAASAATPAEAVGYLERAQNRDGGFGAAPGQASVDLYSGWATLGLAAQGINPADAARPRGRSALDYARARARGLARARTPEEIGDLERTILVAVAAGEDPRAFAGQDLVAALRARFDRDGSMLQQANLTAFGILALRAARVGRRAAPVAGAVRWLTRQQNRDGGFGFATRGMASDVDVTAAVVQALVAGGAPRAAVRRATAFLRRQQNRDGGLPLLPGGPSNAQSTAWAIQAFVAARVPPGSVRRRGGRTPLAYLASLVGPGGAVQFSRSSRQTPVWVTAQAALAFARRPLPLRPVRRGARRSPQPAAAARPAGRADDGDGGAPLVAIAAAGLAGAAAWGVARRAGARRHGAGGPHAGG